MVHPLAPDHARPLTDAPLTCTLVSDVAEAERLCPAWAELARRSARDELTLSPEWLLTWWQVYGGLGGRRLRLGLFHEGDRLVGLAPLLRRRHWHGRVLPFRRLELLASGEPPEHGIYSNHLSFLAERGAEPRVAGRFVEALATGVLGTWDEVVLPMMPGDTPWPGLLVDAFRAAGFRAEPTEIARAPYLPLPSTWDGYLRSLSASGRRSVQRSLKAFDAWAGGTTRLENVTTLADLEKGKEILVRLHHERWGADGEAGVFRSPHFVQFHDILMRRLAERGALELLWLSARGEPVAVLYGMTWAGKVYAYQTGRRTDVPAALRPGAVLLMLAIRRAIEAGRREFDLLADEAPYKLQLAPCSRPMVHVRAARGTLVEYLRRAAHGCRHIFRSLRRGDR
jgi:CelD/BcsL family acetyltransferase involved in cellulose biosynthesis